MAIKIEAVSKEFSDFSGRDDKLTRLIGDADNNLKHLLGMTNETVAAIGRRVAELAKEGVTGSEIDDFKKDKDISKYLSELDKHIGARKKSFAEYTKYTADYKSLQSAMEKWLKTLDAEITGFLKKKVWEFDINSTNIGKWQALLKSGQATKKDISEKLGTFDATLGGLDPNKFGDTADAEIAKAIKFNSGATLSKKEAAQKDQGAFAEKAKLRDARLNPRVLKHAEAQAHELAKKIHETCKKLHDDYLPARGKMIGGARTEAQMQSLWKSAEEDLKALSAIVEPIQADRKDVGRALQDSKVIALVAACEKILDTARKEMKWIGQEMAKVTA